MACYYREMFGLGLFVALIVFVIIIFFEEVIEKGFRRIGRILNIGIL